MSDNNRALKVFLCHAHSDKDTVKALYARLKREGVDVWLDKEKLLPGADWELEIRKAVREADVVVVCLSKQFNQAGFRQKEVRIALDTAMEKPEGEIFIIPARLEECDTLESLRKWHWVDLFESDGFQRLILALRVRANKIGATLRERGHATVSRPKIKDEQKAAAEKARLEAEEAERQRLAREKAEKDAQEKAAAEKARLEAEELERRRLAREIAEQADREAVEKAAREKMEKDSAEKARLEAEELERQRIAKEKADHEAAEKATREKARREAEELARRKSPKEKKTSNAVKIYLVIIVGFVVLILAYIFGLPSLTSQSEATPSIALTRMSTFGLTPAGFTPTPKLDSKLIYKSRKDFFTDKEYGEYIKSVIQPDMRVRAIVNYESVKDGMEGTFFSTGNNEDLCLIIWDVNLNTNPNPYQIPIGFPEDKLSYAGFVYWYQIEIIP